MYSVRVTYLLLERSCEVKTINVSIPGVPCYQAGKYYVIFTFTPPFSSRRGNSENSCVKWEKTWYLHPLIQETEKRNLCKLEFPPCRTKKPFVASQSTLKVIRDCVTKSSQHPPSSQIQTEKYFNLWGQDILCLFFKTFFHCRKKGSFFPFLLSPKPIVYWLQKGKCFIEVRRGEE